MQNINLEGISNNTSGMPDCWYIDYTGKPSPEVFQKRFGLPRSMRNDKSFLAVALSREKRLTQFVNRLLHYRNLSLPFVLFGDPDVSPETHAIARYDPEWHLRNEQDLTEVSKLEESDLGDKIAALLATRRNKQFKSKQVKLQALANRTNLSVDRAWEIMCKCALEAWLRARNDLANWDLLDSERKEELAEVVFAGFTFFGKAALEDVSAVEPRIFDYYRSFCGLLTARRSSVPQTRVVSGLAALSADHESLSAEASTDDSDIQTSSEKIALQSSDRVVVKLEDASKADLLNEADVHELPKQSQMVVEATSSGVFAATPASLDELFSTVIAMSRGAQSDLDFALSAGQRIRDILDKHLQRLVDLRRRLTDDEVLLLINR